MFGFMLVLLIWIFSVCLHEFGHAWVAERGGDYTVREKGYLTMNPGYYAHPVISFLLPMVFLVMGGFALPGGAVYIERHLIRSRGWNTAVSLAGPAMNLILAILLTLVLRFVLIPYYPDNAATCLIAFTVALQVSAILFNLIPIPPLDGFQAIAPWLSSDAQEQSRQLGDYGMFILFMLFWRIKALNYAFWYVVFLITHLMGVDLHLVKQGYHQFRFWEH